MRDLEHKLAKLLESARQLPPGRERHELLKEIGRLRVKIDAIITKQRHQQSEE